MWDPISIVEASYDPAESEKLWLERLVDRIAPQLPSEMGVMGFLFDRHAPSQSLISDCVATGAVAAFSGIVAALYSQMPDEQRRFLLSGSPPIATLSSLSGMRAGLSLESVGVGEMTAQIGFSDTAVLCATDPSGQGCAIGTLLQREFRFSRAATLAWARVAAHIAAGLRLQRGVARLRQDAILQPSGKLEDASPAAQAPAAREALRQAARAMDRARSRVRHKEPEHALAMWRALVNGRWSLIDRFESDGRRYVVAVQNSPASPDPRGLTESERLVASYAGLGYPNKVIGYALGISEGTVAALLARAKRKLRVTSRAELVDLFTAWESARATASTAELDGSELLVLAKPASAARVPELTEVEMRVAGAAAAGVATPEIARTLGRSPHTVAKTLTRVYRKLDVSSRAELARCLGARS
jgi:DNA-binding CsgD family transcriptional regulator